jgi:hypothetical protein
MLPKGAFAFSAGEFHSPFVVGRTWRHLSRPTLVNSLVIAKSRRQTAKSRHMVRAIVMPAF